MHKKIAAVIAVFMLALGLLAFAPSADANVAPHTPAPTHRKASQTDVTHAPDDSGYTAPIHIVCTDGTHRYLYVGESSVSNDKACNWNGVQRIIVGMDQTVYCKNYLPPYQNKYYYTGNYNEVPSFASLKCYMQRPL